MAERIRGLFPPMITCFGDDGSFDEGRMRDHINFLIENGVHGLIPCGSTGEFVNLTPEEYRKVVDVTMEEVNGRVPVLVGTAQQSTQATVERSRWADEIGADGVMIVPPYYQVLTKREVYEHYRAVREAIDLPIMLYNNPAVSGVDVQPELIAKMVEDGIISYVKEAQGDPSRVQRILELVDGKVTVFYGHDINAVGAFAVGAEGWVSGMANTVPKELRQIFDLCVEKHDYVEAKKVWYKILPLVHLATVSATGERPNWLQVVKEGLEIRGRRVGGVRRPLLPLEREERAKLEEAMRAIGY